MFNLCHISVPDNVFFVKFFVVNNYEDTARANLGCLPIV